MKATTRAAAALVLVAVSGPAGFFLYRGLLTEHLIRRPEPTVTVASHSAAVKTASSGATQQATATARIPDRLPDIALPDRAGQLRRLSDWRGRPLVVNFWATWCAPCRREIPMLERLQRSDRPDHLQVVGIAVDARAAALKYARALHINYPILVAGETRGLAAISAFGMANAVPFTVFADSKGRILTVKVGELHRAQAHLILARLDAVEKGRLTIATARQQIAAGLQALGIQQAQHSAGARGPAGT